MEQISSDIHFILLSKNRTLQAYSCIRSLLDMADDLTEGDISVVYADSPGIPYGPLIDKLRCRFIRQTHFYQNIVDAVSHAGKPFIGFIVDDVIYRDSFLAGHIARLLKENTSLDSFSLRLGRHITDTIDPEFEPIEDNVFTYKTQAGLGRTWNYFWELDSSIYRANHVLDYLKRCRADEITFPNPLESVYYKHMPNFMAGRAAGPRGLPSRVRYLFWKMATPMSMVKKVAFFEHSKAVNQGVNLVADIGIPRKEYISPLKLHALFLKGYYIDPSPLHDIQNQSPHLGPKYFRLINDKGEIYPLSFE